MGNNRPVVTVIYEDQLGPRTTFEEFGPHRLVVACLHDAMDGQYYLLKAYVRCHPAKGSGNVRRAIRNLCTDTRHLVVAVYDNDRVRDLWQCPTASDAEVIAKIKAEVGHLKGPLEVILLRRNIESLLHAAGKCGAQFDSKQFDDAVVHKDLNTRDLLFRQVAVREQRTIRDCVLENVPSAKQLVEMIASRLSSESLGATTH